MKKNNTIKKLLEFSDEEIQSKQSPLPAGRLFESLWNELLSLKNGFYAFEKAVLVRPLTNSDGNYGVIEWNSKTLWRSDYDTDEALLFFSENIFGEQYALSEGGIVLFDPETGEKDFIADDIWGWAEEILLDTNYWTGYRIASEWQKKNGILDNGIRLIPKQPFVLQGEFAIENLIPKSDLISMKIRSQLASHIQQSKEGDKIIFEIE